MPADLTVREDGTVEMAYTGKTPWHGLGTHVDGPMTAAEALEAGGLDWEVEKRPLYIRQEGGPDIEIPNRVSLTRMDTNESFGICSPRYMPVQNVNAFTFFDGVVGAGEAIYHTVGSIRGGRRTWMLAKLPGDLNIGGGDIVEKYILLANSHDGSMQLTFKFTPIRVVCSNTLDAGLLGRDDRQVKFRHTTNVMERINDTREIMGLGEAHFALFMRNAERLADKAFTEANVRTMARKVFEIKSDLDEDKIPARKAAMIDRVVELTAEGRGSQLATAKGTGWGAYNAFAEFIDYELGVAVDRIRTPDVTTEDQRLNISWFGRGQEMRDRAWSSALAIAR